MKEIKGKKVFSMSKDHIPALTVENGDTIVFHTRDCFDNQIMSHEIDLLDWDYINPATGPVYIKEATTKDTLKISILDIEVDECGIMAAIPGNGVLGDQVTKSEVKRVQILDGYAVFREDIKLPCDPMIGVIGVAPKDTNIPCGEPGEHGGNMDNKKVKKGAILYLPIFHEGALLSIGDVHAVMGDGEIMVTGVEIPAKVTVKVEVVKNITIDSPLLEDDEYCYTIASDENIEKAIYQAVKTMNTILAKQLGMSNNEAGMLMSAAGELQICQVVDPKRTVRFAMRKNILHNMI